jgi:hypothetical protein
MNCSKCDTVLIVGKNISKNKYKNTALRGRPGVCQNCQPSDQAEKAEKQIKGKTRYKIIIPDGVITAETQDTCVANADLIANTLLPTATEVLFMDLHNTFDFFIEYAKRGKKEMVEVKELLNGLEIIIVTFVGWNNKTTELAIADIKWAIEHLGVKSGVAVSERNHAGTTPESQTFIGGKGWVIDLITKSQFFPKTKWYFSDDSDDHLVSVKAMNPECAGVVKCIDIDQLWGWTNSLKLKK